MMQKLGFYEAWITKIMNCVTTVSCVILVNGQPGQLLTSTRGLHQGDRISLYLYLICAEGLSSLINVVESCAKIRRVKVARRSHSINYLFFADDNIIFYRAITND